ncbi:MAG: hypothetical protein NT078_00535 [Candidatus Azambacteria bacterium]|nr:hypothetical protein [Candidatus Azambacteria bacterium]
MINFESTLFETIKIFSDEFELKIINHDQAVLRCGTDDSLLTINKNEFEFFDEQVIKYLNQNKNKLTDAFVDFNDLKTFCRCLKKESKNITLNHLGLCYQVEAKSLERNRLMGVVKERNIHLYEMPSNDSTLWLFVGNKSSPESPLIELLPVEKINDYYLDYWLPHVHLALHTNLKAEEIKYLTHTAFKGNRTANPSVVKNNIIYQLRVWLGLISGININLDLATNERWNSLEDTRKMLRTLV